MQELFQKIKQVKSYIDEAEDIYERLGRRQDPILILLPLAFRYALDKNEEQRFADERLVAFVGQYLSTKYPEVSQYFVGKTHRESIESLKKTLDDFFEEKA